MPRRIRVGPNEEIKEPHLVPQLEPGDRVFIDGRPEPYKSKLQVPCNDVLIEGRPDPYGNLPILEGNGAIESKWAKYYSDQVSKQGVISVIPDTNGEKLKNVAVRGLRLRNARASGQGFVNAQGQNMGWNFAASGVAIYRAQDVTVEACVISDNDNGIFGKSYGDGVGDLENIKVSWSNFYDNGVPGNFHYHNTYLEGINTVYEFNHFYNPKSGSAGCNVKDRSAGAIFRYNYIRGGARTLDLVDPEDGAPTLTKHPSFGKTYVYGNHIVNPIWGGSATPVHFGFDGLAQNAQKELFFHFNTLININDREDGGRWYTYLFKLNGGIIHAANNIFHSYCPTPGHSSGDFYIGAEEYVDGSTVNLKSNFFPAWTQKGAAVVVNGMETNISTPDNDPDFAYLENEVIVLKPTSECRRKATPLITGLSPYIPKFGLTRNKTFAPRLTALNVGVAE